MLIGHIDTATVAVFLSGRFKSSFFKSEGNQTWGGLIIPEIQIEVDETSALNASIFDAPMLSMIRTGTKFAVVAKSGSSFGHPKMMVTLQDDLTSAGDFQAVFKRWQIVLGEGEKKRVVWSSESSG